jgi:hypothetical protein
VLQEFGGSENVGGLGIAAEGYHGRVLEEQENISNLTGFAQLDQLLLQTQGGRVINGAERDDGDGVHFRHGLTGMNTRR